MSLRYSLWRSGYFGLSRSSIIALLTHFCHILQHSAHLPFNARFPHFFPQPLSPFCIVNLLYVQHETVRYQLGVLPTLSVLPHVYIWSTQPRLGLELFAPRCFFVPSPVSFPSYYSELRRMFSLRCSVLISLHDPLGQPCLLEKDHYCSFSSPLGCDLVFLGPVMQ